MKVTLADFEAYEWRVGRSYLSLGAWDGDTRTSRFRHPQGHVEIYEWAAKRGTPDRVTGLRFIYDGVEYCRRWETIWSPRTLARLAREMIEDIVAQAERQRLCITGDLEPKIYWRDRQCE